MGRAERRCRRFSFQRSDIDSNQRGELSFAILPTHLQPTACCKFRYVLEGERSLAFWNEKNFETEISFMCNVGFVSGGLQPLHYKQLLALYTDVTSLGHAEDEVRNVLFPRLMCPQVKRLCQPIFSEGPGPPFEDIYWLAVQVSFCDPRIYKLS